MARVNATEQIIEKIYVNNLQITRAKRLNNSVGSYTSYMLHLLAANVSSYPCVNVYCVIKVGTLIQILQHFLVPFPMVTVISSMIVSYFSLVTVFVVENRTFQSSLHQIHRLLLVKNSYPS